MAREPPSVQLTVPGRSFRKIAASSRLWLRARMTAARDLWSHVFPPRSMVRTAGSSFRLARWCVMVDMYAVMEAELTVRVRTEPPKDVGRDDVLGQLSASDSCDDGFLAAEEVTFGSTSSDRSI